MGRRVRVLSIFLAAVVAALAAALIFRPSGTGALAGGASARDAVDMALIIAVDVSGSVDDRRFELQMDGVAAAFESQAVQAAILSGPRRSILVAFVEWSHKPSLALPWTRLANATEIKAYARQVRALKRLGGDFTCMSKMMQYVTEKLLPMAPADAGKKILDISADGQDNCNGSRSVDSWRDEIVGLGATINGLPVLNGGRDQTLERWFADHVVGGEQSFVLPALGYDDFGRAIQLKLVAEISGLTPPHFASSSARRLVRR